MPPLCVRRLAERCPECGGPIDSSTLRAAANAVETQPQNYLFFVFLCAWIGGFITIVSGAALSPSLISRFLGVLGLMLIWGPTFMVARSAASVGTAQRDGFMSVLLYIKVLLMMLPAIAIGYGLAWLMSGLA